MSYTDGRAQQTLPGHIHHFVYRSKGQGWATYVTSTAKGQLVETYDYDCSFLSCSAHAVVRVASPTLSTEAVRILTDPEQLRKRSDDAIATFPERLSGISRPRPIDVLNNLRTYISDALHNTAKSKSIAATNKRFMICFGARGLPCKELLEYLDFKAKVWT